MSEAEMITVWRAPRNYRIGAAWVCVALVAMSVWVLVVYGALALIGVALVLALVARTWWQLVRPRMTAGPDGIEIVSGRRPERITWSEIRRCEPTVEGIKIVCSGGREVLARYPQQPPRPVPERTEADATAAYLAQRAAWERKPTGPAPVYDPPPKPVRT
jgi:hypothetical protein